MRAVLTVIITLLLTASLQAGIFCFRCRSHSCRCAHVVAKAVTYPAVGTNIYIANINNPTVPNGTSAYVANGGYQSQVLPLYDPNIVTSNTMQLLKAMQESIPLGLQRMEQHAERLTVLQASTVNTLAVGKSVSDAFTAAQPQKLVNASFTGVKVEADGYGGVTVKPLAAEDAAAAAAPTPAPEHTPTPDAISTDYPVFQANCAKCHGVDNTQPSGGLYLGAESNVAKSMNLAVIYDAVDHLGPKPMPPASQPQLTEEDKARLKLELRAMIRSATQPVSKE